MSAAYQIHHASVYRGHGILRVEILDAGGRGSLHVEGDPTRIIKITGGRSIWNPNNELTHYLLLYIEPPLFPIHELVGKKLIRSAVGE